MRFFSVAAALFCVATVTASPTAPSYEALAERADKGDLEARTLLNLWGNNNKDECNDWWKVKLCKLKGTNYFCNKDCSCEYKPPQKQCNDWDKKECEKKDRSRYSWNSHECKCEDKGCDKYQKDKCLHEGGTYNDHECKCTPKPKCPDNVKWDCEAKKSPRYVFNKEHCRCDDVGCPHGAKDKCLHEGGTYDEHKCYCTPKPKCPDYVKKDCEAKHSPRYQFSEHECKCVDKGCPYGAKDKCLHEGGKYDEHKCVCTPKKQEPQCPKYEKEECEHWGGDYNSEHCKCYPKQQEKCKSWLKVLICKKLGKSCNERCDCF